MKKFTYYLIVLFFVLFQFSYSQPTNVTVEAGDLLVSNGDGTAKKQDDDIIRSKTVAKVNSNIKVETYSDGSYTVPCTLHC